MWKQGIVKNRFLNLPILDALHCVLIYVCKLKYIYACM